MKYEIEIRNGQKLMTEELIQNCITEYGKALFSFCLRLTGNRSDAEDLYQDTFLKLMEKRKVVDVHINLKGYLFSIAVNLWKNESRKRIRREWLLGGTVSLDEHNDEGVDKVEIIPDSKMTPEEETIQKEATEILWRSVEELQERYRIVLFLFYTGELSLKEIADVLHIPEGTVKSRMNTAKRKLHELLLRQEQGDIV